MTCYYVPPHVIDHLARQDYCAACTARQSYVTRKQRIDWNPFPSDAVQSAPRYVYDSGGKFQVHVNLVRHEGEEPIQDAVANTAYDFAGLIRDYLKGIGFDGLDNKGSALVLNVHFGAKFMNAFWNGTEMVLGDGDGELFLPLGGSLDVLAHEMGHGVIQHTANLDYYGQSGALNEHFADVIGTLVQQWHLRQDAGDADWLMGNEIMGPKLKGEALRSMKAPGTAYDSKLMGRDPQPDHASQYFTGPQDNYGVHINSGIFNRIFYLVSYDLGTHVAGKIWMEALKHLWPTAQFADAKEVIVSAATRLVPMQAPSGAVQTVRLAFREVGLI